MELHVLPVDSALLSELILALSLRGFGSKEMLMQFPLVSQGSGMKVEVTILSGDPEVPGKSFMFSGDSIPKPFDTILSVKEDNEGSN